MSTSAERQARRRARQREQGLIFVQVTLAGDDVALLRDLYQRTQQGVTFDAWLAGALLTGAKFRANAGGCLPAGHKAR